MFKGTMHDLLLDTLQVLNRKDRLDLVVHVQQQYHEQYLRQEGIVEVTGEEIVGYVLVGQRGHTVAVARGIPDLQVDRRVRREQGEEGAFGFFYLGEGQRASPRDDPQ